MLPDYQWVVSLHEPGGVELNRFSRLMPAAVITLLALSPAFWAGCSNNDDPVNVEKPSKIEVRAILVNPLSPVPGGTAQLTAQVEGFGNAGTYEWTVSGGTIDGNGKINVIWTVPDQSNVVYRIFVRGTSGTAVDTMSTYVLVRNIEAIDTGLSFTLNPQLIEGDLYYVGTNGNPSDRLFRGFHAYKYALPPNPIDKQTTPTIDGGYDFAFFTGGLVTSSISGGAAIQRQQPMNVYYFPLSAGTMRSISDNQIVGTTYRKNQNVFPSASSDLSMYVWQYNKVGSSDDGRKDLVNIRFRYSTEPIKTLTSSVDSVYILGAWVYSYYRNIRPMFTPDNETIVYFTDSTNFYEPCLIPMNGTEPLVSEARALMVDSRHGIFFNAGVTVSEGTVFQWNPTIPTQLAFIDTQRRFCIFDYVAETVQIMAEGVIEFVWSQDGKLASTTDDGVYVLEPGQTVAKRIFTKERSSDDVIGINWSSGLENQRLGFRMLRKGSAPIESFSALVIYLVSEDRWYYASGQIRPAMLNEPSVNYTWMRGLFDPLSDSMYMPVPLSTGGGKIVLYRSY